VTDVARFLDSLRRQQGKYRELAVVAEEQKRVLSGSDIDALMGVVDRKRLIMGEIEQLEKDLAPTKGRWAEIRGSLEPSTIREVESAVEETKRILQELVRLEDEAREALERQRVSTAEQLKDLMKKKQARGAYGAGGGPDPRFIDGQK
jgi:flagellar biosynthesis/type III secretory pathway chaperone